MDLQKGFIFASRGKGENKKNLEKSEFLLHVSNENSNLAISEDYDESPTVAEERIQRAQAKNKVIFPKINKKFSPLDSKIEEVSEELNSIRNSTFQKDTSNSTPNQTNILRQMPTPVGNL